MRSKIALIVAGALMMALCFWLIGMADSQPIVWTIGLAAIGAMFGAGSMGLFERWQPV